MNKRKLKIILSIDGGGIRGVLPLLILNHIDKLVKKHGLGAGISSSIDLVAGTSSGAIISAGLIVKKNNKNLYSLDELLNLYIHRGPQLFKLSNPAHEESEGLRLVLKRKFKDVLLSDLDTKFAFVSYDKNAQLPFVFGRNNQALSSVPLSTALAACSAIPGYFPPVKLNNYKLVDGIMTAKNPALVAYKQAQIYFPNQAYLLLSLGTGKLSGEMYDDIEKNVDAVDQELKNKVAESDRLLYYRFQPEIKTASPMMDNATPENIEALVEDGKSFIEENEALFDRLVEEWKKYQ